MCGRFALFSTSDIVKHLFGLKTVPRIEARYNIAPTDNVLIVRDTQGGREGALVRWGLIPSWAKETDKLPLMINAKAETVAEKPAFRSALETHRCIVPVDGFYEWKTLVGGEKQPMFIHRRDGEPMALAGLWSRWHGTVEGEETVVESCVIITTGSNPLVAPIHDRMPVILDRAERDEWLDRGVTDPGRLGSLLAPFPAKRMEMWAVTQRVNRAGVEGAELIRKEGQQALF